MRKPLIHKIVLALLLIFILGITISCAEKTNDFPDDSKLFLVTLMPESTYIKKSDYQKLLDNADTYGKNHTFSTKIYIKFPYKITSSLDRYAPEAKVSEAVWSIALDFTYNDKEKTVTENKVTLFNKEGKKITETKPKRKIDFNDENLLNDFYYSRALEEFIPRIVAEYNKNKSFSEKTNSLYVQTGIYSNRFRKIKYLYEDEDYKYYVSTVGIFVKYTEIREHEKTNSIEIDDSFNPFTLDNSVTIYYEPKSAIKREKISNNITFSEGITVEINTEIKDKEIWTISRNYYFLEDQQEVYFPAEEYLNKSGRVVYTLYQPTIIVNGEKRYRKTESLDESYEILMAEIKKLIYADYKKYRKKAIEFERKQKEQIGKSN
ncbi:hypothetical protein LJC10_06155 [Selenomonadales bacterium OttesenSCG-928-I06]|nr:hypothetical protein [Selenomonadales bacterium OttesenSCG-928-I06]